MNGDSLATELVELLLAHHVAGHNDERGERSALAVATDHDSTGRSGASLRSGARAERCTVLRCLRGTKSLDRSHCRREVEVQDEKMEAGGCLLYTSPSPRD